jgi:hypothetical protein
MKKNLLWFFGAGIVAVLFLFIRDNTTNEDESSKKQTALRKMQKQRQ